MNEDQEGVMVLSRPVMHSFVLDLVEIDMKLVIQLGSVYSKEVWGFDEFLMTLPFKWEYSRIYIKNGDAKGALIGSIYADRMLHLHRFFVDPDCQNKQIGRELHDSMLEGAKKNGVKAVTLFVASNNNKAIRFYERNGYEKLVGDRLAEIIKQKGRDHVQDDDSFFDENNIMYYAYQLIL